MRRVFLFCVGVGLMVHGWLLTGLGVVVISIYGDRDR